MYRISQRLQRTLLCLPNYYAGRGMKNFIAILFFYVLFLSIGLAESVTVGNAPVITLEQATRQVISNNFASRVLSAKTEEFEGRKVHVIKTLTPDGRIQQQTIDADTGALLDINDSKSETIKE